MLLETINNSLLLLLLLFSLTAAPGSPLCPGGPCRDRNLPWGRANKSCGEDGCSRGVHTTGPTLPSPGDPLSPGGPCSPLTPGGPWGNSNTHVTTLLLSQFGQKGKLTTHSLKEGRGTFGPGGPWIPCGPGSPWNRRHHGNHLQLKDVSEEFSQWICETGLGLRAAPGSSKTQLPVMWLTQHLTRVRSGKRCSPCPEHTRRMIKVTKVGLTDCPSFPFPGGPGGPVTPGSPGVPAGPGCPGLPGSP